MENPAVPEDSRRQEIGADLLRSRLDRESIYDRDVIADLIRLRRLDPIANETVRLLAEKYFPGTEGIRHKEKAVRMLVTAFLVHRETTQTMRTFDVDSFLLELDKLGTAPPDPET